MAPTQGSLSRRVSRYPTPEHGEHTDRLWTNKQVRRCLLKPRYKAKIEHHTTELVNGRRVEVTKTYDGAWTPLVDEETWNGVAATLRDPSRVKCTTFEIAHQGVLDGPGVRKESADLKAKIAEVDSKLGAAARTSPASTLLASGRLLRQRWNEMSPALRGQVVAEVATVTVLPCPRGLRGFDPDYVDVVWREDV